MAVSPAPPTDEAAMVDFVTSQHVAEAAAAVRNATENRPKLALVLGSGLSSLADAVASADVIDVERIPHWPASTVAGHSGRLVFGRVEGQDVVILQGRIHYYEGYSMSQITMPVRVLHHLGIETLLLTNAAGGINREFEAGDLMLIRDHLNFPGLIGHNPLRGPNDETIGPRFPDMTEAYDPDLRRVAHEAADEEGLTLREGVYAFVGGPSFETPAELRFLHTSGADAVGMSTVPTVVVARHAGMRALGISTITNMALLEPEPGQKTSHEEVLEVGKIVVPRLTRLIHRILRKL